MRWKKFLGGVLAASMIFSASTFCSAAEESANAKLVRIEIDTYGAEQSGAILDRISALEKSFSGQNMSGNMNARIEAIYDTLYNNSAGPAILAKINALEWNVNHEVASGGINMRLSVLEDQIFGKMNEGTFNERIRALAKASYGAEILPIAQVQVPANTLIKVETTVPVGSKVLQEGDVIPIRVLSDVFVDDSLVFVRGLPGEGVVTSVRRAKNIFSNGKIEIDFCRLQTIDGQTAQICTGIESQNEMNANEMARGLSLIGQTFSGKNKSLAEIFVRGKNIDLPAGIELYVQIKTPIVVYGVRTTGNALAVAEPVQPVEPAPQPAPAQIESGLRDDELGDLSQQAAKPAPPSEVEPLPAEDKNLDGYDGQIIEIVDEG